MIKFKLVGLSLVLFLASASLSAQTMQDEIKRQAEYMINGMLDGNIDKLLDHTLPAVIDMGGGRSNMKEAISAMLQQTLDQGFTIDTVYVGDAGEVYPAGDDLHALIPQYLKLGFAQGYIESETSLIAISKDKGEKWYFIDIKQLDESTKSMVLPVINENMVIPEPTEPNMVLFEDE